MVKIVQESFPDNMAPRFTASDQVEALGAKSSLTQRMNELHAVADVVVAARNKFMALYASLDREVNAQGIVMKTY